MTAATSRAGSATGGGGCPGRGCRGADMGVGRSGCLFAVVVVVAVVVMRMMVALTICGKMPRWPRRLHDRRPSFDTLLRNILAALPVKTSFHILSSLHSVCSGLAIPDLSSVE